MRRGRLLTDPTLHVAGQMPPESLPPTPRTTRAVLSKRLLDERSGSQAAALADQADAQQALDDAWNAGYAAAVEAERSSASFQALSTLSELAATVRALHTATVDTAQQAFTVSLGDVVHTAESLTRWILDQEPTGPALPTLLDRLTRAVPHLPVGSGVTLVVATDHAQAIQAWASTAAGLPALPEIQVDPALRPGEARIEVDGLTAADLTLAAGLREAMDAITSDL